MDNFVPTINAGVRDASVQIFISTPLGQVCLSGTFLELKHECRSKMCIAKIEVLRGQ